MTMAPGQAATGRYAEAGGMRLHYYEAGPDAAGRAARR